MDKALNALFKLDENTEVGDIGNFSFDNGTGGIIIECSLPWVGLKLFYAKREPFVFPVNFLDHGLDGITFGIFLSRVFDTFRPGKVRDMDKSVNTFFNADKDTEISDILYLAFDDGAHRIVFTDQVPGIGVQLFHAQGNTLCFCFYIEDHDLNFVANRNEF
jgi:hypothetical protein